MTFLDPLKQSFLLVRTRVYIYVCMVDMNIDMIPRLKIESIGREWLGVGLRWIASLNVLIDARLDCQLLVPSII